MKQSKRDEGTSRSRVSRWKRLFPALFCFLLVSSMALLLGPDVSIQLIFWPSFLVTYLLTKRLQWPNDNLLATLCGGLLSLCLPDTNIGMIPFVGFIFLLIAVEKTQSYLSALVSGAIAGGWFVFLSNSWAILALARVSESSRFISFPLIIPFIISMFWKFPLLALLLRLNIRRFRIPNEIFLPLAMGSLETFKFEMYPWHFSIGQTDYLRLIQCVDLVGIPGLAAVLILINVVLWRVWRFFRKQEPVFPWKSVVAGLLVLLFTLGYGEVRIRQVKNAEREAKRINVAVVQPNSPYKVMKAEVEKKKQIRETIYSLTRSVIQDSSPDLIVYPEGAAAMGYQTDINPEVKDLYHRIAREANCPIIVDNVHAKQIAGRWVLYRSALLLSPGETVLNEYFKHKLVPFGEYVPGARKMSWLGRIFQHASGNLNYQPGTEFTLFDVAGVRIAPQLCYESIFPGLTRQHIRRGAEMIVNLSNDAWYGRHQEPAQHFKNTVFRCIENRVPMVRSTNSGISAYVSATGEIQGEISPLHTTWTACRTVPVPTLKSFYRRFGNVFGWCCVLFLLFCFAKSIKAGRGQGGR